MSGQGPSEGLQGLRASLSRGSSHHKAALFTTPAPDQHPPPASLLASARSANQLPVGGDRQSDSQTSPASVTGPAPPTAACESHAQNQPKKQNAAFTTHAVKEALLISQSSSKDVIRPRHHQLSMSTSPKSQTGHSLRAEAEDEDEKHFPAASWASEGSVMSSASSLSLPSKGSIHYGTQHQHVIAAPQQQSEEEASCSSVLYSLERDADSQEEDPREDCDQAEATQEQEEAKDAESAIMADLNTPEHKRRSARAFNQVISELRKKQGAGSMGASSSVSSIIGRLSTTACI